MITRKHYEDIAKKHGAYASWAVWANEDEKAKSNIGDLSVFDLEKNPGLLNILNPNIIMVGLNFSRSIEDQTFVNFHDIRSIGQDYKIRYAFRDTEFYGAYMTDIIKNYENNKANSVMAYVRKNKEFMLQNVEFFKEELRDLGCINPLIIAFGNDTYHLLHKYFGEAYQIKKVLHYSHYISKEDYRRTVLESLRSTVEVSATV